MLRARILSLVGLGALGLCGLASAAVQRPECDSSRLLSEALERVAASTTEEGQTAVRAWACAATYDELAGAADSLAAEDWEALQLGLSSGDEQALIAWRAGSCHSRGKRDVVDARLQLMRFGSPDAMDEWNLCQISTTRDSGVGLECEVAKRTDKVLTLEVTLPEWRRFPFTGRPEPEFEASGGRVLAERAIEPLSREDPFQWYVDVSRLDRDGAVLFRGSARRESCSVLIPPEKRFEFEATVTRKVRIEEPITQRFEKTASSKDCEIREQVMELFCLPDNAIVKSAKMRQRSANTRCGSKVLSAVPSAGRRNCVEARLQLAGCGYTKKNPYLVEVLKGPGDCLGRAFVSYEVYAEGVLVSESEESHTFEPRELTGKKMRLSELEPEPGAQWSFVVRARGRQGAERWGFELTSAQPANEAQGFAAAVDDEGVLEITTSGER